MNKAYQVVRGKEKIQERKDTISRQVEQIEAGELPELEGLFDVISIDPPWQYEAQKETSYDPSSRRAANPYPEMSFEEIKALDIPASKDSILCLWTTQKYLPRSFELLEEWGFEYRATIVWNKEKMGLGRWFRMQCEFVVFATKGKPFWNNTKYRDLLSEPRREHSRKPDSFFEMMDEMTVGRKLEYFSREKREGWEVFGNDVNKF